MTITTHDPEGAPPSPFYSQAAAVTGADRLVFVSGQVGVGADGVPGDGIAAQAQLAIANLGAALAAAGLTTEHVVKSTTYLTDVAHLEPFMAAAAGGLPTHRPAITLLVVAGLASPDLLVEIEAVAAA